MLAVIQRVSEASVRVDGNVFGAINRGVLIMLGVESGDDETAAEKLATKALSVRCFAEEVLEQNGVKRHFERSVKDIGGEILVVSQFTLAGKTRKGTRPAFDRAAPPGEAERLYLHFVDQLIESGLKVETGKFAAMMEVALVNEGPVTLLLGSADSPAPWAGK